MRRRICVAYEEEDTCLGAFLIGMYEEEDMCGI
jgi:hypothetical protein